MYKKIAVPLDGSKLAECVLPHIEQTAGGYCYIARYYDAGIGRFISADTVVQNPDNPHQCNT